MSKFEITVTAEPEHEDVRGHFADDDVDTENMVTDIIERVREGDEWAWCCVKVTVSCAGMEESEYLGCCSYQSEADFRANSGYFDDMVQECKGRLVAAAHAVLAADAAERGQTSETLFYEADASAAALHEAQRFEGMAARGDADPRVVALWLQLAKRYRALAAGGE